VYLALRSAVPFKEFKDAPAEKDDRLLAEDVAPRSMGIRRRESYPDQPGKSAPDRDAAPR
jgi:hypothetical protein